MDNNSIIRRRKLRLLFVDFIFLSLIVANCANIYNDREYWEVAP